MLTSFAVRSPSTDALGSAEAGRELCERVVDGETTGGGHIFAGTHSGNGISVVRWAPDAVCLILTGLFTVVPSLNFSQEAMVMAILGIVAGVFIVIGR